MTPWTAARQASLSITDSQSLLRLLSIELVMPSHHLILCHPLLLLPSPFPKFSITSRKPSSLGPDENHGTFLLPGPGACLRSQLLKGQVCRGRRGREAEKSWGSSWTWALGSSVPEGGVWGWGWIILLVPSAAPQLCSLSHSDSGKPQSRGL